MMDTKTEIRAATPEDCNRILEIYAPYILHTPITFEYEIPSVDEFRYRIEQTLTRYPYLVALIDGTIVGYTYVSAFKSRPAYDWSVETSVYIDEHYHGQGIGSALYRELELILKKQRICNLCACIAYPNPESIRFHELHGFQTVAHFHKCGYKFNTWYDMVWMEKMIGDHLQEQMSVIPFKEVL